MGLKSDNIGLNNKNESYIITVIVRTHNSEKFVKTSINSLINQTLPENLYEILVVDDGSSDDTLKILEEYKNKLKVIKKNQVRAY